MPISRGEFESGQIDPSVLIIEFLRSNSNCAYTFDELREELASREVDLPLEDIQNALDSLIERSRVERKTIGDIVYYIYSKRIGFRKQ